MNKLLNYLQEVQKKKGYEPVRDDIMGCEICGRKADILNGGKGDLICCGQPMIKVGEALVDRHDYGETSVAEKKRVT